MSFKNIDIITLRTFVHIVDSGTFNLAAQKLGMTQSALSQQIKRLEKMLGVELFDTVGRNKPINENGKRIYPLAVELLAMNDAIIDTTIQLKRARKKTINK